jgi:hypothetical protein
MLFGPGMWNWDLSAGKAFTIPKLETHQLHLRADFLDAFNHFNLGNPGTTVAATQFGGAPITTTGKIFGGSGSRVIQLGVRYVF